MKEEIPYWYKLISNWVNEGYDGLTIPFILGAKRFLYGDEEFGEDEIFDLLSEIKNSDFDKHIITFYHCDIKLDEKVLGLFSKLNANHYQGIKFLNNVTNQISFAVGNEVKLGETIEEISSKLNAEYQGKIEKKQFSKYNKTEWGPLTPKEEKFIKDTMSIDSLKER